MKSSLATGEPRDYCHSGCPLYESLAVPNGSPICICGSHGVERRPGWTCLNPELSLHQRIEKLDQLIAEDEMAG